MTTADDRLKGQVRQCRAARAGPRPWTPSRFSRVAAIVARYGLTEAFLAEAAAPAEALLDHLGVQFHKAPLALPLFGLATEDQYRLAQRLMALADNPYLDYAATPADVLLSAPLYRLNPHIPAAELAGAPFTLLLARELQRPAPRP
jgi:hypothetical protein